MAVIRVQKTENYTVMSNHHLRNKELSLKGKGLLSLMLSLPDEWDYTVRGLTYICKDGEDCIRATIRELERAGYVKRERVRDAAGRFTSTEYVIHEHPIALSRAPPQRENPDVENPVVDNPVVGKPGVADPVVENPAQLSTKESNTDKSITDLSITHSFFQAQGAEGMNDSDVSTITYKLNVYTLNFDAKGGTLPSDMPSSVQVTSRSVCDFSNIVPTKTGCIFKGWYLSETPAENEDPIVEYAPNIENTPNKTVTFYAGWEPIEYKVTFDPNGGIVPTTYPPQTFIYDVEQELNENQFTRDGYTFIGWNTVKDPTETNLGASYIDKQSVKNLTTISEEITLYAQWEANKTTITVTMPTYSDIQGELKEPIKNDDGTKMTFTVPEGVSYTHNIWYVNGEEKQQNTGSTNEWTFDTTNLLGGIYTIMLVVVDSNGNKYSAEYQVTVTK